MGDQRISDHVQPAKVPYDHAARAAETCGCPPAKLPPSKGTIKCVKCKRELCFDEFPSLTDPYCRDCRSTASTEELNEMKARMCKDFSVKLHATAENRLPLEHIEAFLAELMYDFGGMRLFVKCWSEQLKRSFEREPGSYKNLDQCRSIAKLVMDCNKLQHQEDVLDLSDEQLRVQKELALMKMLDDAAGDPHRRGLLIELMRSNGITLGEIPGLEYAGEVINAD